MSLTLLQPPLQWYADRIRQGPFALSRYGDGELYCMLGHPGGNANGCAYTPELHRELLASLQHPEPDFLYGLQRITPTDKVVLGDLLEREKAPQTTWYDTGLIPHEFWGGRMYPLLAALREQCLVLVTNNTHRPLNQTKPEPVVEYADFIEVPAANAHLVKDEVYRKIKEYQNPACFVFSCGMAACVFVSELYGKVCPGSYLLDLGHIWDAFVGVKSRYYHLEMTEEQVWRNLRP